MASKDYLKVMNSLANKRTKLNAQARAAIRREYEQLYRDVTKELKNKKGVSRSYYLGLQRSIKQQLKYIDSNNTKMIIKQATEISNEIAKAHSKYYNKLSTTDLFNKVFSKVPDRVMDNLIQGKVYQDGLGLSKRIWNITNKYGQTIDSVIRKSIAAGESVDMLANRLLSFLRNDITGDKAYYTYRLANTTITHSYQLTIQQINRDNPFCEGILWIAAGGKSCPLCQSRDGIIYESNFNYGNYTTEPLPWEHPNGQCIMIPQMQDSDTISEQLKEWLYNGDTLIDEWTNGF